MDTSRLAGKIAADKNSNKLGKIIRVEKIVGKTIKKLKPHAFILVHRIFKRDAIIPIETDLVTKIADQFVWFDISKEDFDKLVRDQRAVKETREIYGKFVDAPGNIKVPMNLPRNRRKE